MGHCSKGR